MLLLVNILIGFTGVVDGLIESSVEETVAAGYDGLDENGEQNYSADYDDEWLVSTAERVYFANSITNPEEVLDGSDATHDMMGPFIYEVTTTREILDFDYENGSITYSEYDVFEWCENCTWTDDDGKAHDSVSGDTNVTQVNILWNTQRIGGMGSGIEYGEIFAKAMFAAQMIEFDLSNRAPSIWASEDIGAMAIDAGGSRFGNGSGEEALLSATYQETGQSASVWSVPTKTHPTTGEISLNYSVFKTIFYYAEDEYDHCIALTCDIGPVLIAGMGAPSDTVTPARAGLLGYNHWSADEMAALDWAVYSLAASKFSEHGGGADINNQTPLLKERFSEVSGLSEQAIGGTMPTDPNTNKLENLLFNESVGLLSSFEVSGIPLPGMVIGLLLPLQSGDYYGAMTTYGLGLLPIGGLAGYVEPWVGLGLLGAPTEFEEILVGGEGTMNSDEWWLTAFGDYDPLGGIYIPIGLNRESFAGMSSLSAEKSDFILNDPEIGLKSSFPASFMYGELSGLSLPDSQGVQHVWDDSYVATLYGIDIDAAHALRDWVGNFYFDTVMPVLLTFVTGNTAYTTQPVSNWLYGWNDAVNTYFGFFPWVSLETNDTYFGSGYWENVSGYWENGIGEEDPDNDTWIDATSTWIVGVSTGDRSVYKMSTRGETVGQRISQGYINSDGDGLCDYDYDANGSFIGFEVDCTENQIYGMTEHLPWRAPHREQAAEGLLSAHVGNNETVLSGTVGGLVANPQASFDLNLIGYAIAHSEVLGDTTFKGIDMVQHSVTLDPAKNQIQGKLIGSETFVDAMPGALPVYLGAELDMKVEPVSTVLMYGKVKVTFYLDQRGPGSMSPDFSENSTDVLPVFEIHSFSEIGDEDAKSFRGKVSDNMGVMGWTNLGGDAGAPLSYLHGGIGMLYVLSFAMIGWGARDSFEP